MTMVAAVLIAATRSVYGADSTTRGADFRLIVAQAVARAGDVVPNADLVVVVAPEYFFSRFNPYTRNFAGTRSDIAPVTRSEKHGFYDDIVAASRAHPNVLIVGGTIFYSKTKGIINKSKVAMNVCPVAFGGSIKHKIYKRDDDMTASFYDGDLTYKQKTGKSDPVFEEGASAFRSISARTTDARGTSSAMAARSTFTSWFPPETVRPKRPGPSTSSIATWAETRPAPRTPLPAPGAQNWMLPVPRRWHRSTA